MAAFSLATSEVDHVSEESPDWGPHDVQDVEAAQRLAGHEAVHVLLTVLVSERGQSRIKCHMLSLDGETNPDRSPLS
jgi:hypothetical protein